VYDSSDSSHRSITFNVLESLMNVRRSASYYVVFFQTLYIYVSVYGCICIFICCDFIINNNLDFNYFYRNMFLQPGLKDLNARSRSTSPFPFIRQPRGYSGQDASHMSRPGSSSARLAPSAGNSFGSWDMPMVSTGIFFVCDVMLKHGLQAELSGDSGRLSSQLFSDDPAASRHLSYGTSLQNTSDGSLSSRFSSRGSLLIDKEIYESQLYAKELEQKIVKLETKCTTLQYVSSISLTCRVSGLRWTQTGI
jgi:hypothetical protein